MRDKTNYFTSVEDENVSYMEGFKEPKGRVVKIDDCYIEQELKKINSKEKVQEVSKMFNGKLRTFIEEKSIHIKNEVVPILTYEEYLREYKNEIIESKGEPNPNKLSRFWVHGSGGVSVANVIIINKYPGKPIMLNELYKGNNLVKCIEYDFYEVQEELKSIEKRIPEV